MTQPSKRASSDATKLMRAIQRLTGYGEVRVTLASTGDFQAYAYPNAEAARQTVIARLQAGHLADPAPSLGGFSAAVNYVANTPLAFGQGKSIEDALDGLMHKVNTVAPLTPP
jgi:hypothetical protein